MSAHQSRAPAARGPARWREHALALLIYAALSLALSWPTARHFATSLTSNGIDARHNLWVFWHTREALLGRQPLFDAPLLYYPRGISLLTHGVGPLTGLFALPFWPWGPAAAHNGALLVALMLTGYCTYLLARGLGLDRAAALFAGLLALAAPMPLAGLHDHITKVFLGALPLALLALHRALDPRRSPWWAAGTALALLAALLHDGWQFVKGALAVGLLLLLALRAAPRAQRAFLLRRSALLALAGLALVGPLLLAISAAARNPDINVDVRQESLASAPDLLQFILPPRNSALLGTITQAFERTYAPDRAILHSSETAVSLALAGLALGLLALLKSRPARPWLLLTALCVLFALGPAVYVLGQPYLVDRMPYALLVRAPGLSFMRMPGRFMQLGCITFAVAAAFGLAWLRQRYPRRRGAITLAAALLVLVEVWPPPAPSEALPPVPRFYQQIAADPEQYGVFDLPLKASDSLSYNWKTVWSSSSHQVFQMTHGKGIAGGYISRTYTRHPLFADVMTDHVATLLLDGLPAARASFRYDLARYGYRYVVLHKGLFGGPPGAGPGEPAARALLGAVFPGRAPLVDDALSTVYAVQPVTDTVALRWGAGWHTQEPGWRWGASPATLSVSAAARQPALLQITPAVLHDPGQPSQLGGSGLLGIQVGASPPVTVTVLVDRVASVPIELAQGDQTITLTLAAGNFRPDGSDSSPAVSFAAGAINLQTVGRLAPPPDVLIGGAQQRAAPGQPLALLAEGWYAREPDGRGRWSSSPAGLLIYSPRPAAARLRLRFGSVYVGPRGLGQEGSLLVVGDGGAQHLPIRAGQPTQADLPLRAGWNRVGLALEAGNFQPSDLLPGSGDQRRLSFLIERAEIELLER